MNRYIIVITYLFTVRRKHDGHILGTGRMTSHAVLNIEQQMQLFHAINNGIYLGEAAKYVSIDIVSEQC